MRYWITGLCLIALGVAGCKHQCFLAEKDFHSAHLLPVAAETDRHLGVEPLAYPVPAPADINNADRSPRYLTLQEAIAVSLENGTANPRGIPQGLVDDTPVSYTTGSNTGIINQSDSMRVLALAPALNYAGLEQSLSRFDAQWVSAINWSVTDQLQQGLTNFNNGQRAQFFTGIMKPLPTGGVISTFLESDYQLLDNPPTGNPFGVLNPTYTTRLRLGFEQPLLQSFGTDINQLLNRLSPISGTTVPGQAASAFNQRGQVLGQIPSVTSVPQEGILIARLRFNASRAEFERVVNSLVVNVEVAYWNLYQAYGELYTFEEVLRIAHRLWMINQAKFVAGTIEPANFFPIRAQYEEFRGERLKALGKVLEAERNLRGLMGLPVEDGERLVPVTPPTLAPYRPNWELCLHDAMYLRPELVIAREALRAAQYNLEIQKNFLKPDLRFVAQFVPTGFGTKLDGRDTFVDGAGQTRPRNALQSLTSTSFEDWTLGLTMSVPIGFRLEHAAIRAGRLGLAQSFYALKDQEERIQRFLTQQYQKLSEWHARIEAAKEERKSYAESVEVRFQQFKSDKERVSDFLLEAQRRLALALQKEYQAIAEYNATLARLEWAKGTILKHNNIIIAEGGLPQCAEIRAVEHERERARSIVLREKPLPMEHPGRLAHNVDDLPERLEVPATAAEKTGFDPARPELVDPEKLPPPRKVVEPEKKGPPVPDRLDEIPLSDGPVFKARGSESKKSSSGWTPTRKETTPARKMAPLPTSPAPATPQEVKPEVPAAPRLAPVPELPGVETPRVELPKTELPKAELPKVDLPPVPDLLKEAPLPRSDAAPTPPPLPVPPPPAKDVSLPSLPPLPELPGTPPASSENSLPPAPPGADLLPGTVTLPPTTPLLPPDPPTPR